VLVDRDDLTLAAVQTDSLENTSNNTRPPHYRVRIGPALYVKALRRTRKQVGVERLLAFLLSVGSDVRPR
jgi:hypothetical protein